MEVNANPNMIFKVSKYTCTAGIFLETKMPTPRIPKVDDESMLESKLRYGSLVNTKSSKLGATLKTQGY